MGSNGQPCPLLSSPALYMPLSTAPRLSVPRCVPMTVTWLVCHVIYIFLLTLRQTGDRYLSVNLSQHCTHELVSCTRENNAEVDGEGMAVGE